MSKIIVLDTSFLLELFQVPVDSDPKLHAPALELMREAIEGAYDVYCTVGVLYEMANHIVDIKNPAAQKGIAQQFKEMVEMSWVDGTPFTIIPGASSSELVLELSKLPDLCVTYQESIRQRLSLVDCVIIDLAKRLRESYRSRQKNWPAHIWSRHGSLKALEPDKFEHLYF
ncbi:PIN domain-containing protein [Pseudomonas sp. AA27]|uniref:PIN domain-containing protein n=1 Tax=Pseudomonas sp. AA27 TaxID=2908652 RepID=UPI001F300008|nr:PIN domain-containing protein [Pseudomonas sp. AA27]MCF1486937.1 PIN domain-containing protein [Pseudomonas sp. AA27]